MGRSKLMFLAVAALLPPICAAGTTAQLARTLPMTELARKLLGDSGEVMIDLDRPRFEGVLSQFAFTATQL